MKSDLLSRRLLLKHVVGLGMLAAVELLVPAAYALTNTTIDPSSQTTLSGDVIDLTISEQLFSLGGDWPRHHSEFLSPRLCGSSLSLCDDNRCIS